MTRSVHGSYLLYRDPCPPTVVSVSGPEGTRSDPRTRPGTGRLPVDGAGFGGTDRSIFLVPPGTSHRLWRGEEVPSGRVSRRTEGRGGGATLHLRYSLARRTARRRPGTAEELNIESRPLDGMRESRHTPRVEG